MTIRNVKVNIIGYMVYTKKIDRETLIIVVSDLLEQEGIDAVSMRRLAQALDVRPSSLYHHFPDKSALLDAVAEKGLHQLTAELDQALDCSSLEAVKQLHALGMAYREWALLHPQLYLLLFGSIPLEEYPSLIESAPPAALHAVAARLVGEQKALSAAQVVWAYLHGFVMLELAGEMRLGVPVESFLLGLEALAQGIASNHITPP